MPRAPRRCAVAAEPRIARLRCCRREMPDQARHDGRKSVFRFVILEVGGIATGLGDGGVVVEGGADIDDVAEIREMEEAVIKRTGSSEEIVVNCVVGILTNTVKNSVGLYVAVPDAGDYFGVGVAVLELGYEVGDFHREY